MRWKLYLNIRQKVIFGLTLGIMAVALVGELSFRYLKEIERKQHLVEVADDLNNVILEIRRYEKNFLLYGSVQDFTERSGTCRFPCRSSCFGCFRKGP